MFRKLSFICLLATLVFPWRLGSQDRRDDASRPLVVVQISDLHIGLARNGKTGQPIDPMETLQRVIPMVNERNPDIVLVTGDIGENPRAWEQARQALGQLRAPVRYVPGNHDVNSTNVARYRSVFGEDYYKFQLRNATFYVLDSQLLGNYDHFSAPEPEPLPPQTVAESNKMLKWLEGEVAHADPGGIRIAVQHVPTSRGGNRVPDQKPYWITQEPYRSREIDLLHRLGVKHIFAGHWHKAVTFDEHGFTHHIAPALSWATQGPLGFLVHTISPDGKVKTEVVEIR